MIDLGPLLLNVDDGLWRAALEWSLPCQSGNFVITANIALPLA